MGSSFFILHSAFILLVVQSCLLLALGYLVRRVEAFQATTMLSFRRSCAATTKENLASDLASCQTFSRVRIGSCTTTVTLARRSSREVRRRKLAKMAFARVLVAPSSIQTETGKACGCLRVRLCLRRIA